MMRGKSHICLGRYLAARYLKDASRWQVKAFLFGCIEPDRNPATYLKGSIRHQWLRGHNYPNASRFMHRLSLRLEQKESLNLLDYYALGKLIHYTADAFTYAHNDTFPNALSDHMEYEDALQEYFLCYIRRNPTVEVPAYDSIMDGIHRCHREYRSQSPNIHTDSHYALKACCCIFAFLLAPKFI